MPPQTRAAHAMLTNAKGLCVADLAFLGDLLAAEGIESCDNMTANKVPYNQPCNQQPHSQQVRTEPSPLHGEFNAAEKLAGPHNVARHWW